MKQIKTAFTALILVFAMTACNNQQKVNTAINNEVYVATSLSKSVNYTPKLYYSGTAFAYREANLGAALPGRVEKFNFNEGDKVEKGKLLVELSSEMLMQAKAENTAIKKDHERVKRLVNKGSLSQQKFDHVKAKLIASNAKVAQFEKSARIYAPFTGTVVEALMEEGENFFLNPSFEPGYSHTSGIVRLMQLHPVKVNIQVNEKELSKINKGQKAQIVFDAYPDSVFTGFVVNIKPMLSTLTHTAEVSIKVDNMKHLIKPGMYASVTLDLNEKSGIEVPYSALLKVAGTGEEFVFEVLKNNTVKRHKIQVIDQVRDKYIISGIQPRIRIIVAGKNKVNEGMKVVVNNK